MMTNTNYVFIVEKGIDGLLAALYVSFTDKISPKDIFTHGNFQSVMGCEILNAGAEKSEKERVKKALFRYGGNLIIYRLKACVSSDEKGAYMTAFDFAYKTLLLRRNIYMNMSDPVVSKFQYTVEKVLNEQHRQKGFLRFVETERGILYSTYAPDNDITELVAPHFLERLRGIPFVIHDIKRNKVAVSDGFLIKYGYTDTAATIRLSENEKEFSALFKRYFNDVNIKERKNLRQQNNYMPKKFRKFMPETYEDI